VLGLFRVDLEVVFHDLSQSWVALTGRLRLLRLKSPQMVMVARGSQTELCLRTFLEFFKHNCPFGMLVARSVDLSSGNLSVLSDCLLWQEAHHLVPLLDRATSQLSFVFLEWHLSLVMSPVLSFLYQRQI
jgi:hypothetical protein